LPQLSSRLLPTACLMTTGRPTETASRRSTPLPPSRRRSS